MVSYGYTLDHIAPERGFARANAGRDEDRPFPPVVCCALILGASAVLWLGVIEVVSNVSL